MFVSTEERLQTLMPTPEFTNFKPYIIDNKN